MKDDDFIDASFAAELKALVARGTACRGFPAPCVAPLRVGMRLRAKRTPLPAAPEAPATGYGDGSVGVPLAMKITRICQALMLTAALSGCVEEFTSGPDQCMRREIFMQCMAALPAGPNEVKYNDWSEVVGQCETVAYYQSVRETTAIKPECR